jgi:Trypsin-co-occurring domain 1
MAGRAVVMRVGGMDLLVETMPVTGTEQTSGKLEKAQEAVADAFDRAQSAIVAVAESTVRTIGQLGKRSVHPDEMQVTCGLKFSAQGNVIVAGAAGEATLEVALTYRRAADVADEVSGGGDGD